MDRKNIDKIARNTDDKLLLAKVYDKIDAGIRRNTPANTCFLSAGELEMARYLFGSVDGLVSFGGYPNAERRMYIYFPDYLSEAYLTSDDAPIVCLHAEYSKEAPPLSHRDLLGALMALGIARETVGDISVGPGSFDFFVSREIAPFVLQNLTEAGRVKLIIRQQPLNDLRITEPETKQITDTLSSLRLDGVIAAGFRISRRQASQYVSSGKAAIDGITCEKPDRCILVGSKISVRGLGKIVLSEIKGTTKKERISVVIDRYV